MHLDDEQVQRLLHGELSPSSATLARGHLAACAACRRRVGVAGAEEKEVFDLLRQLDHRMPDVQVRSIMQRGSHRRSPGLRWAAGVVMAIGLAGVAYGAPGSPVRAWVDGLVGGTSGVVAPTPLPDEYTPTPASGGIAITPGEDLTIVFDTTAGGGDVRVSLTDGSDVVIRAPAGSAEYTAREARVLVTPRADAAIYEIDIPRSAVRVEIRRGGARMFLKHGADVSGATRFPLRSM